MRILSARFRNLNSLVGDWEINFEDPAMNSEGIFLITGPTGSGKTTILDAISLALYGRTPRLEVISNTQNEIMSRNTGECQAEVVFETAEGRFRATWSQNRAYGRPNGNLSAPKHQLAFESGRIIADKKSAAAAEIAKKTGLTFEEFTQASLLAQGQFAKFLGEKEHKKAELLEKVTGTSIYRELSQAAYARSKAEDAKRDSLKDNLNKLGANLLGEDEERRKIEELANIGKTLEALDKSLAATREALAWMENIAKLRAEKAKLAAERVDFERRSEAFRGEKEALTRAKVASRGVPVRSALDAAIAGATRARDSATARENELATLKAALEEESKKHILYQANTLKVKAALDDAAPLFDSVKKLDAEISAKGKETSEQNRRVEDARKRRDEALKKKERDEIGRETANKKLAEVRSWLAARKADGDLRENLGTILEKLASLDKGLVGIADIEKRINSDRDALRVLLARQGKLNDERERGFRSRQDIRAARSRLEETRLKELKGFDPPYWEKRISELNEAYKSALERKELDVLRRELRPDAPCPLCGSLHHPWAERDLPDETGAIRERLEEARRVVSEASRLEKEIDKAEKDEISKNAETEKIQEALRGIEEQKNLLDSALGEKERQRAQLQTELERSKISLSDLLAPLGLNRALMSPDLKERLLERRDAWLKMEKEGETASASLAESANIIAADVERLKAIDEELAGLEKDLNRLRAEGNDQLNRRREIFGDKSVDAELAALKEAVALAEKRESESATNQNIQTARASAVEGAIAEAKNQERDWNEKAARSAESWRAFLSDANISDEEYAAWRMPEEEIERLERKKSSLDEERARRDALAKNIDESLAREEARALSSDTPEDAREAIETAEKEKNILLEKRAALKKEMEEQTKLKNELRDEREAFAAQEREAAKWSKLSSLIGSAKGESFRDFAQNVTLDFLLRRANDQLRRIYPRYELSRAPDKNMDIRVIDYYQGGEIRPVVNLSGGESFIVSLSLALGLSAIASRKTAIGSLFLDEGFGTLDADMLETAMTALRSLSGEGKLIGVISHVDRLKEWINARIETSAPRQGRSELSATGCDAVKRHATSNRKK